MKTPRKNKKEVDLLVPIDVDTLVSSGPDDCFGKEWDPSDKDCSICHDVEICGILKQSTIKSRKKEIEKKVGPMLDQTAFEKVPVGLIVDNIKTWSKSDPATYDELFESISLHAQTKDGVAVREFIARMLPKYGLKITEQKTIIPNESVHTRVSAEYPATKEDSFPGPKV